MTVTPQEKNTWRIGARSTMDAASQLRLEDRTEVQIPVTYKYPVKPV